MRVFFFRVRRFLRRQEHERSMDREMRAHIELETQARVAAGMSLDEARRTAARDFGGVERYKEEARDQRGFRILEDAARDARFAFRVLRRNLGYATAAAVTLALGVACTTAIYSVVQGVLLLSLPYANPQQLVVIWERNATRGVKQNVVSVPMFEALRDDNRSLSSIAALVPQPVTLGGAEPERVMGAAVSPSYFRLLGVSPAIGRGFVDAEGVTDGSNVMNAGAHVVVLSDGLWRRRFGGDRSVVGRTIPLGGQPYVVIGIMPADFDPPVFGWLPRHELWVPWGATADNRNWGPFLLVIARLRDGVSLDAAGRELVTIAERHGRVDPGLKEWSTTVVSLTTQITGEVRRPLLMVFGAVGLLLLLAATNVTSLVLGFMRRREQEQMVRRAIGASAARLFRELLIHGVVLGAIGCALGLVLAALAVRALVVVLPPDVPRLSFIHFDSRVALFGVALGLAASVGCGLVVALRSASLPYGAARSNGTRTTARVGRGSLVVIEIALGVVLTVMAGLMIKSFTNLRAVRLGFDTRGVVAARVSLPHASYGSPERQRLFFDVLGERLRASPGIAAAGFVRSRPFACCAPATTVRNPEDSKLEAWGVDVRYADSSYFVALGIPALSGAGFAGRERADGVPHVVINQSLARAIYRGSPIGRPIHIVIGDPVTNDTLVRGIIVGVVGDVHLADARTAPRGTVYLATERFPSETHDIVLRANAGLDAAIGMLRARVREMDPTLPLSMVATLQHDVGASLARDRFTTLILAAFALASLLLAAVGTYGVFAADVTARRKEIGIRLALGARETSVVGLIMRRALVLAGTGAALGVAAGLLASRSMSAILFEVPTSDPASFGAVALLLIGVAAVATLIPSARAARSSPVEAIRMD